MFAKPNATKKRSTADPALPTRASIKGEASEKKMPKVATLKSKLSLKDLRKEFRREKDVPLLSSLPKLGGRLSNEAKRPSSDADTHSLPDQNVNEAKLYVPKTRKDDVHPYSAPPHTSSFSESATTDKQSQDSILSFTPKVAPCLPEEGPEINHPFTVFSSGYNGKVREDQVDNQLFMAPRPPPLPPALPRKAKAREEQKINQNHIPMDESRSYGVSSHGCHLPPHPGHQNTETLEQQLAAHVDSLHYNINTAAQRLSKTFENSDIWTTDQILRKAETMTDVARAINFRTVTQAELVKDLSRFIVDVVHQETCQLENRMKAFVQQEIAKLKGEPGKLIASNVRTDPNQVQNSKSSGTDTLNQGGQGWAKTVMDSNKQGQYQNERTSRQMPMKREDSAFNKSDQRKPSVEPRQESKPVSGLRAKGQSIEQEPTDNIPTPTAAIRTPNPLNNNFVPVLTKCNTIKDPGEELSGSPGSKAAKLNISGLLPITEGSQTAERNRVTALQPESDTKSRGAISSEDLKTSRDKRMLRSFLRHKDNNHLGPGLRISRRTNEGHSPADQSQCPHLASLTPTKPFAFGNSASISNAVADSQIHRENYPSLVYQALPSPYQKQIMLDRESQIQSHTHSLCASYSHHNFDTKVSRSHSPPLPPPPSFISYGPSAARYAFGMSMATSASSSSFQDPRAYQGNMQCHSSTSVPQSSPPLSPHDQGQIQPHPQYYFGPYSAFTYGHGSNSLPHQFDGVEWNVNSAGNVPILNEAGYPVNNFF
ncbi:hypothetical protein BJX63DRAFT_436290 [Aspergillus granulosus]|uniref:Uncharacterized protein n=1 Tax=Aspergillus granulosus TaxID=176169 RepID=A0ABR4GYF4_9EURO